VGGGGGGGGAGGGGGGGGGVKIGSADPSACGADSASAEWAVTTGPGSAGAASRSSTIALGSGKGGSTSSVGTLVGSSNGNALGPTAASPGTNPTAFSSRPTRTVGAMSAFR